MCLAGGSALGCLAVSIACAGSKSLGFVNSLFPRPLESGFSHHFNSSDARWGRLVT